MMRMIQSESRVGMHDGKNNNPEKPVVLDVRFDVAELGIHLWRALDSSRVRRSGRLKWTLDCDVCQDQGRLNL